MQQNSFLLLIAFKQTIKHPANGNNIKEGVALFACSEALSFWPDLA